MTKWINCHKTYLKVAADQMNNFSIGYNPVYVLDSLSGEPFLKCLANLTTKQVIICFQKHRRERLYLNKTKIYLDSYPVFFLKFHEHSLKFKIYTVYFEVFQIRFCLYFLVSQDSIQFHFSEFFFQNN